MVFGDGLDLVLTAIGGFTRLFSTYLLCKAVYKDARENDDKNAVLWTILTVFFDWLTVIIYAFFRYKKSKKFVSCAHCGKMVSSKEPVCMFCKQPVNDAPKRNFVSTEVKKYLVLAAIYSAVTLIVKGISLFF